MQKCISVHTAYHVRFSLTRLPLSAKLRYSFPVIVKGSCSMVRGMDFWIISRASPEVTLFISPSAVRRRCWGEFWVVSKSNSEARITFNRKYTESAKFQENMNMNATRTPYVHKGCVFELMLLWRRLHFYNRSGRGEGVLFK